MKYYTLLRYYRSVIISTQYVTETQKRDLTEIHSAELLFKAFVFFAPVSQ